MADEKMNCRYVTIKDVLYIRAEDVVTWVKHIVATEETDVRWRFNEAVDKLVKPTINNI